MATLRRRNAILEGMVRLRKESPTINLTSSMVFFYIAENPGISITELAELTQIEIPTVSRIVKMLACAPSNGRRQLSTCLVEKFCNAHDPRARVLHLSPAGHRLCALLEKVITDAVPIVGDG